MLLKEEISRIKKIMNLSEGLFDDFNISDFKKMDPPSNDSKETKKEIDYLLDLINDTSSYNDLKNYNKNYFYFNSSKLKSNYCFSIEGG